MSKKSKKTNKTTQSSRSSSVGGPSGDGQPVCRLFLATPTQFDTEVLAPLLKVALESGDVACLMIGHEDEGELEKAASAMTAMAQQKDVAVVIEGSVDVALKCGADGVVVGTVEGAYKNARAVLGDDKIVGVDCGLDRHAAMALGEAGADFVIFDDEEKSHDDANCQHDEIDTQAPTQLSDAQVNEPVGNWWARVFEVPCVVMAPHSSVNAKASIKSGVEFLCPASQMWENVSAVGNTVKEFNQLIEDTPVDEG